MCSPCWRPNAWPATAAKVQMHGLRLDRRADALRGGESGVPAVVPGNSGRAC